MKTKIPGYPWKIGDRVRIVTRVEVKGSKQLLYIKSYGKSGKIVRIEKMGTRDYEIEIRFKHLKRKESRELYFMEDELEYEFRVCPRKARPKGRSFCKVKRSSRFKYRKYN